MDEASSQFLLEALQPDITYKDTNCHKAVTAEERLSVFLNFMATGKLKNLPSESAFASGNTKHK